MNHQSSSPGESFRTNTNFAILLASRHERAQAKTNITIMAETVSARIHQSQRAEMRTTTTQSGIAHTAQELPERKQRKSVAFAEGQTIVDENGEVTESTEPLGRKNSAESHAVPNGDSGPAGEKQVDEMTAMFEGLAKKKKKKPKKEDEEAVEDKAEPAEDGGEVDLSALKKKKKKKATEKDFDAKLAEAGEAEDKDGDGAETGKKEVAAEDGVQDGDLMKGTGIWAHDESKPVNYESLLNRFFTLLHDSHPDLASSGGKSYKIPPPQCLREGNKKTIFANIADICKRMKRTDEHVTQFLFAELGTSGSVDGSRRLVIKGRFQQKQIENVLRRYIGKLYPNTPFRVRSEDHANFNSGVRNLQDLPVPRHRAQQRREPPLLRHLQLVRLTKVRHRHQDRVLGAGREAQAYPGLKLRLLLLARRKGFLVVGVVWACILFRDLEWWCTRGW